MFHLKIDWKYFIVLLFENQHEKKHNIQNVMHTIPGRWHCNYGDKVKTLPGFKHTANQAVCPSAHKATDTEGN